jgi:hypothetical protein
MRSPPVRACRTNNSSTSQANDAEWRTRGQTKQRAGISGENSSKTCQPLPLFFLSSNFSIGKGLM